MTERRANLLILAGVLIFFFFGGWLLIDLGEKKSDAFESWCTERGMSMLRRSGQLYCHRSDGALFYPPVTP